MAFTDQAARAADQTVRDRVRVALMTAALQVMGEGEEAHSDAAYGKRQALAYDVLRSAADGGLLNAFVWAVVANPAVTPQAADNDIQFSVNAAWGDLAGVRIN